MEKTTMNEDVTPIENEVIFQPKHVIVFGGWYIGVWIPSKKTTRLLDAIRRLMSPPITTIFGNSFSKELG